MTADLNNVTDAEVQAQIDQIDAQVAEAGPEDSSVADNSSDLATAMVEGSGIKDITEIVRAVGEAFGAKKPNIFEAAPSEEEEERQKNKKARVKKPSLPMPGEVTGKRAFKNGEGLDKKMGGKDAEFASMFKITRSSVGKRGSRFMGVKASANDDMVGPEKRREMTALRAKLHQRLEDGFHIPPGAHQLTQAQTQQMNTGDMRVEDRVADVGSADLKASIARTTGNDQIMNGPTFGNPQNA